MRPSERLPRVTRGDPGVGLGLAMEPRRLRLAQQEPGRGERGEHGSLRGDLGVAAADRFEERVAGLDGGPFAVGAAPRPGDLGGVSVRPQAERVELADPDLGRVVDLTDRGRHDRRRILRATLGQGQRRERRIDRLDELDVLGPRGERGERQEVVGGLLEAASGEGQAPDQLLGQDLVDPQRTDVLGAPDRPLALVPASQPEERVGLPGEHVRAEEAHQAEPLGRGDGDIGQLDRLLEPPRGIDHPDDVGVGPPDVVDDVELLGDGQRGAEVVEPLVDLAADAPAEAARVERMALDVAGSDDLRDA